MREEREDVVKGGENVADPPLWRRAVSALLRAVDPDDGSLLKREPLEGNGGNQGGQKGKYWLRHPRKVLGLHARIQSNLRME